MRRKITVIGQGPAAAAAALLLAQRDVADLVLVGLAAEVAEDLAAAGAVLGFAPELAAGAWLETAGSDAVVLTELPEDAARELGERCPDAVLVLATPEPAEAVAVVLDATHLPRSRVVGVRGAGGPFSSAAEAERVVDAVLHDRGRELPFPVLLREGEAVVAVRARVGAGGVAEVL